MAIKNNNKFQISGLDQLQLGNGEGQIPSYAKDDYFIAEHDGKAYSISPYDIAKDVLSNHLRFKVSRNTPKGHNILSAIYCYDEGEQQASSLLTAVTLQDGILSDVQFDDDTHILSLYFNSIDPAAAMITVDMGSLVDIYGVESPLCANTDGGDGHTFGVDLSALSTSLNLSNYALSSSLSAYALSSSLSAYVLKHEFYIQTGQKTLDIYPQIHYCWNKPIPENGTLLMNIWDYGPGYSEYTANMANEWFANISVTEEQRVQQPSVIIYPPASTTLIDATDGLKYAKITKQISCLTHFHIQRFIPGHLRVEITEYQSL